MKKVLAILALGGVLLTMNALADKPRGTVSTTQSRMSWFQCAEGSDAGWNCMVNGKCALSTGVPVPCEDSPTNCTLGPLTMANLNRCRAEWHAANTEP
jgi:hypothetical protein